MDAQRDSATPSRRRALPLYDPTSSEDEQEQVGRRRRDMFHEKEGLFEGKVQGRGWTQEEEGGRRTRMRGLEGG